MELDAVLFVSKRLQALVAAFVCLAFVQLAIAATEPRTTAAPVVKVAISSRPG